MDRAAHSLQQGCSPLLRVYHVFVIVWVMCLDDKWQLMAHRNMTLKSRQAES